MRVEAIVNGESADARRTAVAYIYIPAAMDTELSFISRTVSTLTYVWKGMFIKGDLNTNSNYRKDFLYRQKPIYT
jgi:hypothetical protein